MGKNKFGGNKAKKMARKHSIPVERKTRYQKEEGEIYGCCNKIHGGGQIQVLCIDGLERLCFIRKKFKGRGKKDNIINIGTLILVGVREFESIIDNKLQKCDLLEVYSSHDKYNLEQHHPTLNWNMFTDVGVVDTFMAKESSNNIEFTDNTNQVDISTFSIVPEKPLSDSDIDLDEI
jgi:translation initiation factor 1A